MLAFTLPQVESLRPTKTPWGQALSVAEHQANQALNQRRRRLEPVNSRVKRGRSVQDRIRLGQEGVRALVMERWGALHNCRVRLNPWLPMI